MKGGEMLQNGAVFPPGIFEVDWDVDEDALDNSIKLAAVRKYLNDMDNAFALIDEGFKKGNWHYPMKYEDGFAMIISSILYLNGNVLDPLKTKGDIALLDNNIEEAIESYLAILKTGNSLSGNPFLVSRVIETGLYDAGLIAINNMIEKYDLSEAELKRLLNEIEKCYKSRGSVSEAYETEYISLALWIKDGLKSGSSYSETLKWLSFGAPQEIEKNLLTAVMSKYTVDFNDEIDTYREYIDLLKSAPFKEYFKISPDLKDWQLLYKKLGVPIEPCVGKMCFQLISTPNMNAIPKFAYEEGHWREVMTHIAILLYKKQNNKIPENLGELSGLLEAQIVIDPYSGGKFIYKPDNGDFFLYGVGANGIDEGGKRERAFYSSYEPDLIIHIPRSVAEELEKQEAAEAAARACEDEGDGGDEEESDDESEE